VPLKVPLWPQGCDDPPERGVLVEGGLTASGKKNIAGVPQNP
jgi:hypothetical protein